MTSLLEKYQVDLGDIKDIHWKSQDCTQSDVLFYRLNDTKDEKIELFRKRLERKSFSKCFVNQKIEIIENVIFVPDEEWLPLQKEICNELYPTPKVKTIAVTGTNGKTTTVDIIRQCMVSIKKNILTIGTLGVWKNDENIADFGLTSPSYIDFRKCLGKYGSDVDCIAVEVSSHALDQKRYFEFIFDVGAWTSFSQDHLDYHKNMENYFLTKSKIVDVVDTKVFILDSEINILSKLQSSKVEPVSLVDITENDFLKISYNAKNLTLALSCLKELGFDIDKVDFKKLLPPPGRFNITKFKEGYVVIDFAHTPDALENICREIKDSFQDKKLITIFGCGGDRDKTKRALMAESASLYSDYLYITSDNPRTEKPENIIKDIEPGVKIKFESIVDRAEAITKAMSRWPNEIILIAGKGHESYIDQDGKKKPYSDQSVVDGVIND